MDSEAILDELLVLQCQQGSAQAFAKLVDRWQERLLRHACRLIHDEDAAWDIVQETWIAIINGLHRLDDVAAFPAWAFRIMTNKCGDWQRKQHRRRKVRGELADRSTHSRQATGATQMRSGTLKEGMKALSPEQRAAVALYYLEGFSIAEVAEIQSVPEGTVKSRLHHARNFLRRYLGELNDE